jgi:hypothetical protein
MRQFCKYVLSTASQISVSFALLLLKHYTTVRCLLFNPRKESVPPAALRLDYLSYSTDGECALGRTALCTLLTGHSIVTEKICIHFLCSEFYTTC